MLREDSNAMDSARYDPRLNPDLRDEAIEEQHNAEVEQGLEGMQRLVAAQQAVLTTEPAGAPKVTISLWPSAPEEPPAGPATKPPVEEGISLRAELQAEKLSVLKRRAVAAGIDQELIDAALDSGKPKPAIIEVLIAAATDELAKAAEAEAAEAPAAVVEEVVVEEASSARPSYVGDCFVSSSFDIIESPETSPDSTPAASGDEAEATEATAEKEEEKAEADTDADEEFEEYVAGFTPVAATPRPAEEQGDGASADEVEVEAEAAPARRTSLCGHRGPGSDVNDAAAAVSDEPPPWQQFFTEDGLPYYSNGVETAWEPPAKQAPPTHPPPEGTGPREEESPATKDSKASAPDTGVAPEPSQPQPTQPVTSPPVGLAARLASLEARVGLPDGGPRPPLPRICELEAAADLVPATPRGTPKKALASRLMAIEAWANANGL